MGMIEALNLVKRHGAIEILRGVSLSVARGEVAAIIGPSGSGKSTFLRCLNGLERFQAGWVTIDGLRFGAGTNPADWNRIHRAVCRRVGMVFQSFNLFPHRTVLENVMEAPLHVLGLSRDEAVERACRLLDRVGLRDRIDAWPRELSGGQQQRVAIARALVGSPAVILADEPTGALDTKTSVEIMRILQRLNREDGMTVVVVTHEPDVAAYAERVLTVRDGELVGDGAMRRENENARDA
jgi:polar amino acid transport system ATP-binding protein